MGIQSTELCNRLSVLLSDAITKQLCSWLKTQLEQHGGKNWWKHNVVNVLTDGIKRDYERGLYNNIYDFDLYALLKIFRSNYQFLKHPCGLSKNTDKLIDRMIRVRNFCAGHRPASDHNAEEIERWITTTITFSKLINLPLNVQSELESLKYSSKDVSTPEDTSLIRRIYAKHSDLKDCYDGQQLTPSQDRCLETLVDFLNNRNSRCFILNGYAGTGKTFLLGGLVRYLKKLHMIPVLLAPTGRAAQVMQNAHKEKASTIHRYVYALNDIREFSEIGEEGNITFKFYFEITPNSLNNDAIFIVDESSMVSDVLTEDEFIHFGSGRLLTDLLDHINFDANDYLKKVIFVGDSAQLPPVGMPESPAMCKEYLLNECLLSADSFQLTDVIRQDSKSAILQNATSIRKLLESGIYSHFDMQSNDSEVREVKQDQFVFNYLNDSGSRPDVSAIIITKTRSLAASYNKTIREHYFPGESLLLPGDLVMVQRNNYMYSIDLFNGQIGKIIKVSSGSISHEVFINMGRDNEGKRRNVKIELRYRRALIEFYDLEKRTHEVDCYYIENDLYDVDKQEDESALSKAIYLDFRNRNKNLKPNTEQFKRELRSDKFFNALRLKHSYAITAHKSQGGEWTQVYVDFTGSNKLDRDALRWSYTAITRAREQLTVTNALHSKLVPDISMSPSEKINTLINHTDEVPTQGQYECTIPKILEGKGAMVLCLYKLIKSAMCEDVDITSCKEHEYQITFTLSGTSVIKVYYNSKCIISKVILDSIPDGHREQLLAIRGKSIADINVDNNTDISEMTLAMRPVYEKTKKVFEEKGYGFSIETIPTEYLMRLSPHYA